MGNGNICGFLMGFFGNRKEPESKAKDSGGCSLLSMVEIMSCFLCFISPQPNSNW